MSSHKSGQATKAAIYARKSTEQLGVATEAKSVTRQKELALAFALSRGWTVDEHHVFEDDGISGAEFERRPGFMRLMSMLEPKAPFQVLIVSEQKSLGREAFETNYSIKQLAEAGVEIVEYGQGQSLTPRNYMDKMMSAFRSGADEAHREQTSQRVTEAHTRLAKAGRVTGGRVFGYRNQDVCKGVDTHGRPLRSHVERIVDENEAAVVRRIFALYDAGDGLKRIATLLTKEGAMAPKPFRRNTTRVPSSPFDGSTLAPAAGWFPSTVRAVLAREMYHGVIVWNKTRKKNAWGKLDVKKRDESEWVRTSAEDLRIIDEALWQRVASRRQEVEGRMVRFESGRISGRPPKHATKNLLAGLATCGVCGGGLVVEQSNNRKGRYAYYICHRHRHHGAACTNALRIPLADMNEAVLQAVEEHALTPKAIEQVIQLTERDEAREQQNRLEREQKEVETNIARFVALIEKGDPPDSIVARLRQLEARRKDICEELTSFRPIPRLAPQVVENRLAEWRRLLRANVTQGRVVLQRVLAGRIVFTPAHGGYSFEAPTRFDKLFAGVVVPLPAYLQALRGNTRGTEHLGPEDTFEGDYGQLLAQVATGKGWCALHDSNVRPPGS